MLHLQFQTAKDYVKRQATSKTNCNRQTHWCGNIMADTTMASPTSFSTIDIVDTAGRQLHISASPTTTHRSPRVPFLKSLVFDKWQFHYHTQTLLHNSNNLNSKSLLLRHNHQTPCFLFKQSGQPNPIDFNRDLATPAHTNVSYMSHMKMILSLISNSINLTCLRQSWIQLVTKRQSLELMPVT